MTPHTLALLFSIGWLELIILAVLALGVLVVVFAIVFITLKLTRPAK